MNRTPPQQPKFIADLLARLPSTSARPTPQETWHQEDEGALTRGDRAADWMRNGMGSWAFVGTFIGVMIVWALLNTFGPPWDPYPFILLNLFLSMLAGLQGAILLIAAKRQDALSASLARHDYETNVAAKTDVESLLEASRLQIEAIGEFKREIREIRSELAALHDKPADP